MIAAATGADDTPAATDPARLITDPAELLARLGLPESLLPGAVRASKGFALRVPAGFVARMRHGDAHDPLLRQILPVDAELAETPGFVDDPVGDATARVAPGLLHKYAGRALLLATGACAVHCRYCFRRAYPYADTGASPAAWREAFAHLRADASIRELILSGGDPLTLSNRRLRQLLDAAAAVPQLERLRIHTRQPVVDPARVDAGLLDMLQTSRLPVVLVLHVNHASEIDAALADACLRLRTAGVLLLNQSVLLAGVNDTVAALTALSEALFAAGVLPYYLHLLDRVGGAAHFEVSEQQALSMMDSLRAALPGYLVPRLVREEAGRPAKTPVC